MNVARARAATTKMAKPQADAAPREC